MNGLKTILALLVGAYVVPIFAAKGLQLSPEDQAQFVALALASLGIGFRFLSNGPALATVRDWLNKRRELSPDEIGKITDAVWTELRRRQAAKDAKK